MSPCFVLRDKCNLSRRFLANESMINSRPELCSISLDYEAIYYETVSQLLLLSSQLYALWFGKSKERGKEKHELVSRLTAVPRSRLQGEIVERSSALIPKLRCKPRVATYHPLRPITP